MKRGQITVFLSLILSIILAVLSAGIESARTAGMRMKLENAMDMGLYSVFAEYNRELLEHYDLYFIDTSYGGGTPSPYYTGEHLRNYMEHNLKTGKDLLTFHTVDFTGLSAEKAEITKFSFATDDDGAVFKRQAVHYMKDIYGISIIHQIRSQIQKYQSSGIAGKDVDSEREEAERRLHEWKIPSENEGEEEKIPDIDNPADDVNHARNGILTFVIKEGMSVSDKKVQVSDLASHRQLQKGDGIADGTEDIQSNINELLFGKYIEKKCSSYTNPLPHEPLTYETEYILCGKNSDAENLKAAVGKLLKLREASNVIYLFSDSGKQAQAEALAAAIAAAAGFPPLTELIKYSLIFAWAFVESIIDVRILLEGGKVPLIKTAQDWNFEIENIDHFSEALEGGKENGKGLLYNDYLQIFLYFQNKHQKVFRCMDVIELNLRKTAGNGRFRMDGCMDYMEADVSAVSSFGYAFKIKRDYGYEKR